MHRTDERDTMFARAHYTPGSEAYEDYYKRFPEKKNIDDSMRHRPDLCQEGTMTYNEINSPMAASAFQFMRDILPLCEGEVAPEKVEVDPTTMAKRIKGFAKHYGAVAVGITELKDRQPHLLSGGQKQRVAIAGIIAMRPKCIIFDEATAMLDPSGRKEVMNVIEKLKGKITIILTTHYMEEAESLSDIIGIMAKGNLVDVGTAKELIKRAGTKNFEDAFVKIATGGEL